MADRAVLQDIVDLTPCTGCSVQEAVTHPGLLFAPFFGAIFDQRACPSSKTIITLRYGLAHQKSIIPPCAIGPYAPRKLKYLQHNLVCWVVYLDLGDITICYTPHKHATQVTGYRQLAPGTGRLLNRDPHTLSAWSGGVAIRTSCSSLIL